MGHLRSRTHRAEAVNTGRIQVRGSSRYTYNPKPVPPEYEIDGVSHRTDGTCHEDCEDMR